MVIFCLLLSSASYGQEESFQDVHLSKLAAMRHIENYGVKIDLNNSREVKGMLSLFTNDATHFNDELPYNQLFNGVIEIADYKSNLLKINNIDPDICCSRDVSIEPFELNYLNATVINFTDEGIDTSRVEHKIEVHAYKTVDLKTERGLNYKDSLPVTFLVLVNKERDRDGQYYNKAKIKSVSLMENRIRTFSYVTISKEDLDKYKPKLCGDDTLIYQNEKYLLYKSFDKRMIFENPSSNDADDIEVKGEDLTFDKLAKELLKAQKKKKRWGIELSFMPVQELNSTARSQDAEISVAMSKGQNIGIGFAYNYKMGSKLNGTLRLGVGYTQMTSTLGLDYLQINRAAIDPDGYDYERQTFINELTEEGTLNAVMPSLGLSLAMPLDTEGYTEIGLDLSGSYGVLNSTSFRSEARLFHQGYYEGLYGITLDEDYIYDFGAYQGSGEGKWSNLNSVLRVQAGPFVKQRIAKNLSLQFRGLMAFQIVDFKSSSDQTWLEGSTKLFSLDRNITNIESLLFMPELSLVFKCEANKIDCNKSK